MSLSSGAAPTGACCGRIADNVVRFARALRAAGVRVSTDRVLLSLEAVAAVGVESRTDFRAVLMACLVERADDRALFERVFRTFLGAVERLGVPPSLPAVSVHRPTVAGERLSESSSPEDPREAHAIGAHLSASEQERLRKTDFEALSPAEWLAAQQLVSRLAPALPRSATRRFRPSARGSRIDLLRVLRDTARRGGELVVVPRRMRRTRPRPLIVLVDISGSMSRYSRVFLRFVHATAQSARLAGGGLHAFVFGTRLTPISRQIAARDPDTALARVAAVVEDWSGGTRIAACLRHFNQQWARRVGSPSSTVLLFTDGLERSEAEPLANEMACLARSCRRLVWLNPLLRYAGFEPRAAGIRAMLPFVDSVLPAHDIESLEKLAAAIFSERESRWS